MHGDERVTDTEKIFMALQKKGQGETMKTTPQGWFISDLPSCKIFKKVTILLVVINLTKKIQCIGQGSYFILDIWYIESCTVLVYQLPQALGEALLQNLVLAITRAGSPFRPIFLNNVVATLEFQNTVWNQT